ncbi:hypothetical protein SPBR_04738 [Sporothrix brasiliensis 5110]|uniref:Uncharacterized protein n=1 Tax=Sporothrix brasiliensis 5110 TaxID=1398154 RepID=A0A0C2EMV8_9PEZI|nr:uncharacterized protein SPBR_04738 [Sporothrix brasiliensis 5110]KIH87454.1 hypothetical protein SPBR_04738 [Sporothrix brasiliensis 5110]
MDELHTPWSPRAVKRERMASIEAAASAARSEGSEASLPGDASPIRPPTPVACPLRSVEMDGLDRRVTSDVQSIKQEVELASQRQDTGWQQTLRAAKEEIEHDAASSVKQEDRAIRFPNLVQPPHRPPPPAEDTLHARPQPQQRIESLVPWQAAPRPEQEPNVVHHRDGEQLPSALYNDQQQDGPQTRGSFRLPGFARHSRSPEPSWQRPHGDYGAGTSFSPPYPRPIRYVDLSQNFPAPRRQAPQSDAPPQQQQQQQQQQWPRDSQQHARSAHSPERQQDERQRTEPQPDPRRNDADGDIRTASQLGPEQPAPPKRKRRAGGESTAGQKRTRTGRARGRTQNDAAPGRSLPLSGSARQQNHSTRELRPNDNVIRFGLDVWFHGPKSTLSPLTTDALASSFDNTVSFSGGGSFTFTSVPAAAAPGLAPANAAGTTTTATPDGASTAATTAAATDVATAMSSAVTSAVTRAVAAGMTHAAGHADFARPGDTSDTAGHRRRRSGSAAHDRAAWRAHRLQEQHDRLRQANEQRMQDYEEDVRQQTMRRVAHEVEQRQRMRGWRWDRDPRGLVLSPGQATTFQASQAPRASQASQIPPMATSSLSSPPINSMSGQLLQPGPAAYSPPVAAYEHPPPAAAAAGAAMPATSFVQSDRPYGNGMQRDGWPFMPPPQAGPPTQSPSSPETPQFYNTAGEYTHQPGRSLLGTARPAWTAVREGPTAEEAQRQGAVGLGNPCYCDDCRGASNQYGSNGRPS